MAEITVNIRISNIEDRIKRHLSIIGKRIVDANGESLFDKITLSSAEVGILDDFISDAIDDIISNTRDFFSSRSSGSLVFKFSVDTDVNNQKLQPLFEDFCFQHSIGAWMETVQPQLANGYFDAATQQMHNIISLIYNKTI